MKTADGVEIVEGMKLWAVRASPNAEMLELTVKHVHSHPEAADGGWIYMENDDRSWGPSIMFADRKAALRQRMKELMAESDRLKRAARIYEDAAGKIAAELMS
jgi:hypothetical protein